MHMPAFIFGEVSQRQMRIRKKFIHCGLLIAHPEYGDKHKIVGQLQEILNCKNNDFTNIQIMLLMHQTDDHFIQENNRGPVELLTP